MRGIATRSWALFLTMALAAALAACGGGGGDGGSAPSYALTFSPASVTANVASGNSATVTVRATATDAALFSRVVYVYVVDSTQVLLPNIELAQIDARTISATLHTSPALAAGRHQGTLQIQLCADEACTTRLPGSPVPLPYDLTITPAPLQATPTTSTTASVHRGGSIAAPVTVQVTGPSLGWTATSPASWLQITPGAGTGPGTFDVHYLTSTLAEGQYSSSVTVRTSDGQTVALPFSLTVLPTQFTVTSGVPSFAAVNGAPIPAQPLSFALDNGVPTPWSATSSAPWMLATPLSGMTPATVTLQPDPTRGPLASGVHGSDLVLSSAGIPNRTVSTQLTLTTPTLSAPVQALTFGGPRGRDLGSAQALALNLNTGANSWPFTVSGVPGWLSSSTMAGSISQSGTVLSLTPQLSGVTPGSASATVTVTATVNGDTAVLPVTVNLNADQRRLTASEWGVAFTSTPTASTLSRTLTIGDSFAGSALPWTASSDAAWLSVSPNGSTGSASTLVLTANPAALPANAIAYASVTVSTATTGVTPAVVRVALWKGSSTPTTITRLPGNYSHITADKLRPYVYVNNGGSSIDVYHAYTAQLVTTITTVGAALGQMGVSPDGSRLYALDTAARAMAVVDLDSQTLTQTWPLANAVNHRTAVLAVRPAGAEVVLVGDGTAYANGQSLGDPRVLGVDGPLVATPDGRSIFNLAVRYSVDHSAMSGGVVFASQLHGLNTNSGGNLRDVAVNAAGTRVYAASGGGVDEPGRYRCAIVDATDGSYIGSLPGGAAYPNNVEVTRDGRAICGAHIGGDSDIWVHSPAGALLQGYRASMSSGIQDGQLVVTPDGFIVVALTQESQVSFVPIGAP